MTYVHVVKFIILTLRVYHYVRLCYHIISIKFVKATRKMLFHDTTTSTCLSFVDQVVVTIADIFWSASSIKSISISIAFSKYKSSLYALIANVTTVDADEFSQVL